MIFIKRSDAVSVNKNKYCDECGKLVFQYHRVHKEIKYCNACYVRIFKSYNCNNCGSGYREHPDVTIAYCRRCRPLFIPCIRCDKVGYPIGRVTHKGPVCKSCAKYFSNEKACSSCNKYFFSLTTSPSLGIYEPVCVGCLTKHFDKCDNCRRQRRPLRRVGALNLCSKCAKSKYSFCKYCRAKYPSGVGSCCIVCSSKRLVRRKAKITKALFDDIRVQRWFVEFSEWLIDAIGAQPASARINTYINFFEQVNKNPDNWNSDLNILAHMSKGDLRKDGNPIKFFSAKGVQVTSENLKQVASFRAILKSLDFLERESLFFWGNDLLNYCNTCVEKHRKGKTKATTTKQQLSAVVSLIEYLKGKKKTYSQDSLQQFLLFKPGLFASIFGFVKHLQKAGSIVSMPSHRPNTLSSKEVLIKYVTEYMHSRKPRLEEVIAGLRYFHRVPVKLALSVKQSDIKQLTKSTIEVHVGGQVYKIAFGPNTG